MNKNLEELLEIRRDDKLGPRKKVFYHIVCVLEDFEKRIKELELKSNYILTDEELAREKVGGTD